MSDSTQGPGWWQASDGKWYPPDQHPDLGAPTEAVEATPPTAAMPPVAPPAGGPPVVPMGPPPGAPGGPPAGSNNARWIALGVVAALIVALAAFLLLRGDDKKQGVAANSSSPSASSSSSSSSSRSSSSRSSSSSSSSSTSGQLSASEIQSRLIKAADLGAGFTDETFTPDDTNSSPCGDPNVNSQVPPKVDVGNDASSGTAFFEEEVLVYDSESDANQALTLFNQGVGCTQPTVRGGGPASFDGPTDVSSDLSDNVDTADEYDVQTQEAQGKIFVIRSGNVIVAFQFVAQTGSDTSTLPNELDIVNKGLTRLAS
jgi:hypothetical protein